MMHPYKEYETPLDHYNLGHCALLFNDPDAAEHYLFADVRRWQLTHAAP